MSKERIVAFAGVSGDGNIARFCTLKQAKEFISQTENCCLINKRQQETKKFRTDYDEGHRYCNCIRIEEA